MAKAFIQAGVSLNVADNPYMRHFLKTAIPGFDVPARTALGEQCDMLAAQVKQKVQVLVKTAQWVSITTDAATTISGDSLEAVTAHWLGPEWKMMSVVLATFHLEERHTADYVAETVGEVLATWGLDRAVSITTGTALRALVHSRNAPWQMAQRRCSR